MDFGRRVLRQMQKDGAKFLPRQGSLVLNWLCSCLFRSGRLDKVVGVGRRGWEYWWGGLYEILGTECRV